MQLLLTRVRGRRKPRRMWRWRKRLVKREPCELRAIRGRQACGGIPPSGLPLRLLLGRRPRDGRVGRLVLHRRESRPER
jgi:hypothetical protein